MTDLKAIEGLLLRGRKRVLFSVCRVEHGLRERRVLFNDLEEFVC